MADYSEGLDYNSIKWSIYTFPFEVQSLALMNFKESAETGHHFAYHLRLGGKTQWMYRLTKGKKTDVTTGIINSNYQTALFGFGNISIFRALNVRCEGYPTISYGLKRQDEQLPSTTQSYTINDGPGLEYTRQINYTAEKMMVKLSGTQPFRIQRIDIYGKTQYMSRPLTVP